MKYYIVKKIVKKKDPEGIPIIIDILNKSDLEHLKIIDGIILLRRRKLYRRRNRYSKICL